MKVIELNSKEIWTYERQVELLTKMIKEIQEAGIYCVSGQNKIRLGDRDELRQLTEAVSILEQKAAGIVNPRPQVKRPEPEARRQPLTDAEWEEKASVFSALVAEAGL